MTDSCLHSKFDIIQDLPISEELLGAYLEGNLNESEAASVRHSIAQYDEVQSLYDEISASNDIDTSGSYLHLFDTSRDEMDSLSQEVEISGFSDIGSGDEMSAADSMDLPHFPDFTTDNESDFSSFDNDIQI